MFKTIFKAIIYICILLIIYVLLVSTILDICNYVNEPTIYAKPNAIIFSEYILRLPILGNIVKILITKII